MPLSPEERSFRARLAAHRLHATHDGYTLTANARKAFLDRFEREVDPEGLLSTEDRAKRAQHARQAYMLSLAVRSANARRARARGEAAP